MYSSNRRRPALDSSKYPIFNGILNVRKLNEQVPFKETGPGANDECQYRYRQLFLYQEPLTDTPRCAYLSLLN